jgi:hypothetical protein
MHDVVPGTEVPVLGAGVGAPAPARPPMGAATAGDLLFTENGHAHFCEDEAMVNADWHDRRRRPLEAVPALQHQAMLRQHPGHAVSGWIPVHGNHRGDVLAEDAL